MIISNKDFRNRIIQDPKEIQQAREWWEKGQWDKIGSKILIDPFKDHRVGICSYDLSVGDEYLSLRDPDNIKTLEEGNHITIGPSETVLVLTEEYICLPKNITAIVVPRATYIFEGTSICASRIEPTWYGKLLIAFTNLAKNPVALYRGEEFCSCNFMETSTIEGQLTRDKIQFLGRTKIGSVKFIHAKRQELLEPNEVRQEHMKKIVDLYGWPWDVVRGMFVITKKELSEWIEKEIASEIVVEASSAAEKRAFDELSKQYRETTKWTRNLSIGVLTIFGTIAAAFIGAVVAYLIHIL